MVLIFQVVVCSKNSLSVSLEILLLRKINWEMNGGVAVHEKRNFFVKYKCVARRFMEDEHVCTNRVI